MSAARKSGSPKERRTRLRLRGRLRELLVEADRNPPPDSPRQTVVSVIETYLSFAETRLAAGTLGIRKPFLQSFAEAHGFRLIVQCKPFHLEAWLDAHPEWKSDWTKNSALRNVQAAFNWAWKKGVIDANPFRGVSHRAGLPRRDLKPAEFQALLRAIRWENVSQTTWAGSSIPPAVGISLVYRLPAARGL